MDFGISYLMQFVDNKAGLYAFLGLVPIIILYIIRPKPQMRTIPAIIFILKEFGRSQKYSFLRRILRDILFIFHILLVLLLAGAAAQPYYLSDRMSHVENTIIVIDVSASMNTVYWGSSRFSKAVSEAKKNLDGKIGIIAIGDEPVVLLDDGKRDDAIEILDKLKPSDQGSAIGTAVLAAGDILKDKKGRIVVISDFVNTKGVAPEIAKKTLEAKERMVDFINIKDSAKNIGIVDLEIENDETRVTVQNFNPDPAEVSLSVNNAPYSLSIPPNWVEKFKFKHQQGLNTIRIKEDDGLAADNVAYVSIPVKNKIKILLITNDEKSFILPALNAYKNAWNPDVEIEVAKPPMLPLINHNIIIISYATLDKLARADVNHIESLVEKGSKLIVAAQDDLSGSKIEDLLPVELGKMAGEAEITNLHTLEDVTIDISFLKASNYIKAEPKKNSIVLAAASDDSPIIALVNKGPGKVVYYGILDQKSKFKQSISYPIFWQQLIDYLMGIDRISELNRKIGDKKIFDSTADVIFPSKKEAKLDSISFEEAGVYKINGKQVACNLLDKKESEINYNEQESEDRTYDIEDSEFKEKFSIIAYVIYAILALMFLELLFVKIRGDL